jgi:hypothetical protein
VPPWHEIAGRVAVHSVQTVLRYSLLRYRNERSLVEIEYMETEAEAVMMIITITGAVE